MTLKTLKQKPKYSLTLDDDFVQYCELNNIEDIEKLAKEIFKKGFTMLKYGSTPSGIKIKEIVEAKAKELIKEIPKEEIVRDFKKSGTTDLYGE
jgi:uncharacterized FlaG/YvyC family protein